MALLYTNLDQKIKRNYWVKKADVIPTINRSNQFYREKLAAEEELKWQIWYNKSLVVWGLLGWLFGMGVIICR